MLCLRSPLLTVYISIHDTRGLSCALKEKGPNLELQIGHNTWLPILSVEDPTTLYHTVLIFYSPKG